MGIILINLAKCALRGIEKAMKDLFKVTLEDPPQVIREELSGKHRLSADKDECLALVFLKHEEVKGSGFIAVKIQKKIAKKLLAQTGLADNLTDEVIGDACGEFCSLVAGTFKVEMFNLGRGLVSISPPRIYTKGADEEITEIEVLSHYLIDLFHQKEFLLNVEVSFHSVSFTESDEVKDSKK